MKMLKKTSFALSLFASLSFTTILVLVHQNKPVNSQTISTTKSASELVTPNPKPTTLTPSNYTGIVKKVNDIAQQISVRLDVSNGSNGTGVIIARQGNTYYVVTARHVFCDRQVVSPDCESKSSNNTPPAVKIITPHGKSYSLDYQTVEFILGYDALIFSFQSQQNYPIAEIADYQVASNRRQAVFVAGFPKANNSERQLEITGGRVNERYSSSFSTKDSVSRQDISGESLGTSQLALEDSGGFGLIYSNLSSNGMSGGAVLDCQGRLVGINIGSENELLETEEEGNYREYSLGYSLGLPISHIDGYLQSSLRQKIDRGIEVAWLKKVSAIPPEIEDDSSEWKSIESQLLTLEKPVAREISQWMNYGNQLWRYGRYEEAISAFERVIELDKEFDKAYYALGLAYVDLGKKDENETNISHHEALTALKKAIEINNISPYYYWRHLGRILSELGRYESAIGAYNRAIIENKNNPDFVLYVERGNAYRKQGDELRESGQEPLGTSKYNQAFVDYDRAVEINPKHTWAYVGRGIIYYQQQKDNLALANYNKALEINPNYIRAYINRGIVYSQQQKYNLALADYNRVLEIDPDDTGTYIRRGIVYSQQEKYDLALSDYNKALEIDPKDVWAYISRGIVYSQQEKYDLALSDYNKALEIDTKDVWAYISRGIVYSQQEKYDLALNDYNRALEINPYFTRAYVRRGIVYSQQEKYDLALSDYNKAIEIAPNSARAYASRGIVYSQQKKYDLALSDYNKAIEIGLKDVEAYIGRGIVYSQQKKYDLALSDYNKAIEIAPNSAMAYVRRGIVYFQQKKYDLALSDYNKAIEINPNSVKAYVRRGIVYSQQKKYDLALSDYNKAIEINPNSARAYIGRGIVYFQQQKCDLAKQNIETGLNLFKQQGNMQGYRSAIQISKELCHFNLISQPSYNDTYHDYQTNLSICTIVSCLE